MKLHLRRRIAALGWKLSGYHLVGHPLPDRPGIVIGAPHTSNWDFVAFLGVAWLNERPLKVLVKKSWFRPPVGRLLTALGGVPTDREHPAGLVQRLSEEASQPDANFQLVIAPKGTRSPRPYWKSGFYRIARSTGLPVTLASIDSRRKQVEVGPTLTMTGDVAADMDAIRAFYADKAGVHPDKRSEPRLHEESGLRGEAGPRDQESSAQN